MSETEAKAVAAKPCLACDTGELTESQQVDRFQYGDTVPPQIIEVTIPVQTCDNCGLSFADWRAETIRHAAVCAHLGRLTPAEVEQAVKLAGGYAALGVRITAQPEYLERVVKALVIQCEVTDRKIRQYLEQAKRAPPVTAGLSSAEARARLVAASPEDYWDEIVTEVEAAGRQCRHARLLNHQAAHLLAWADMARRQALDERDATVERERVAAPPEEAPREIKEVVSHQQMVNAAKFGTKVPDGVYYCPEEREFYNAETGFRKSVNFRSAWGLRCHEFPVWEGKV